MTTSSDSYRNVTRYQGQDYRFVPTYLRSRDPFSPQSASTDIKPKENQGYYPVTSLWTNTSNGNIWALKGIVSNLANWVLISGGGGGGGNFLGLTLDPAVSSGMSPVQPDPNFIELSSDGSINFLGTAGEISLTALPVLNSLAFHVPAGTLVNPTGGVVDLTSDDGSVTITRTTPSTIDFSAVGGVVSMTGVFTGTDGQTVRPNSGTKLVTFQSPNNSVSVTKDGINANAVDLNAVPTLGLLNVNINGVTNVTPVTTGTNATINFTASGGLSLTNPSANTINFNSSGSGSATSFVTNSGTANPVGGIVNLLGIGALQSFTSATTANTVQIKAPNCAKFIVDANALYGTHTTIQAAINAAVADIAATGGLRTVFIRPGIYTENPVLSNGVNLTAYTCDGISGNCSINGTLSLNNNSTCTVSGLNFITNGTFCINLPGAPSDTTNQFLIAYNCNFIISNSTVGFSVRANNQFRLIGCTGDITLNGATYFNISTHALISFEYCNMKNSSLSDTPDDSSGTVNFDYTIFDHAIFIDGDGRFTANHSIFDTSQANSIPLNIATINPPTVISFCEFLSGSSPGIQLSTIPITFTINLYCSRIDSTSTFAIQGFGTIDYNNLSFTNTSTLVDPNITMTPIGGVGPIIQLTNGLCGLLSGTGSPQGSVTAKQGSLYLRADGSSTVTRAYINTNGATNWTAIMTQT